MPLKVKRVLKKPTFKAKLFRSGSPRVKERKRRRRDVFSFKAAAKLKSS